MKLETLKRGLNKDESFCGSAKDIKLMLDELSLDDSFEIILNMGDCISRNINTNGMIFKFSFFAKSLNNNKNQDINTRIWFTFYPIKKKCILEKIKEDFKLQIIPYLKSEILECIKKISIISFKTNIYVLVNKGKLTIEKRNGVE